MKTIFFVQISTRVCVCFPNCRLFNFNDNSLTLYSCIIYYFMVCDCYLCKSASRLMKTLKVASHFNALIKYKSSLRLCNEMPK